MADKNILEQMLGHLVNEDKQKAEELFHEYVVAKSREIYESLIEAEMDQGDDEMAEKDPQELFQDLDAIVDELQAKFDAMNGDDMGDDMGDEEEMKDEFDLDTVREYVEKVPAGHGAEKKGQAEKADGSAGGLKFSKNDMGGTTANILSGKNGADGGESGSAGGKMRGSALSDTSAKEDNAGNINVPGAKNGKAFSTKEPGHGAEKAGAKETADKAAAGLFRGRR